MMSKTHQTNDCITVKVPVMQHFAINRNQNLYPYTLTTESSIKFFMLERGFEKFSIEQDTTKNSVLILIKCLFCNIKRLQKDIDQYHPIGINFLCRKYTFKEWLMNTKLVKDILRRGD